MDGYPKYRIQITLDDLVTEREGVGFLKQEFMHICLHRNNTLGYVRDKYG